MTGCAFCGSKSNALWLCDQFMLKWPPCPVCYKEELACLATHEGFGYKHSDACVLFCYRCAKDQGVAADINAQARSNGWNPICRARMCEDCRAVVDGKDICPKCLKGAAPRAPVGVSDPLFDL